MAEAPTASRRWVIQENEQGNFTGIQTLSPVLEYRDPSGLEVTLELTFCHRIGGRHDGFHPTREPTILVNEDLMEDDISVVSLKVLGSNYEKFLLKFNLKILQPVDILTPSEILVDYSELQGKGKELSSKFEGTDESNIYWILFEPHLSLMMPLEIVLKIYEGSGLGEPIYQISPLSNKWIDDILAVRPVECDLHQRFWAMYQENRATDASIIVRENGVTTAFKVHWILLEARSPVFAAMVQHDFVEKTNRELNVVDFGVSVVEKFIRFLYTDDCDLQDVGDTTQLLSMADKYDVRKLKMKCEAVLAKTLNAQNAVKILRTSDLHRADLLKDTALKFIRENHEEVMSGPEWKSMTTNLLNDVLKSAFNK